jgi:hypothetical protein
MSDRPTVIVTGMKRAGLQLLADMLREGGVPAEPFKIIHDLESPIVASSGVAIAADPHRIRYLPLHPKRRIGFWIERASAEIIKSIEQENLRDGGARLSKNERLSLMASLRFEFIKARDAAALHFSPMIIFRHADIIDEPQREANRMARLLVQWWPDFNARAAALAVRRIAHAPPPPRTKSHLRLMEDLPADLGVDAPGPLRGPVAGDVAG